MTRQATDQLYIEVDYFTPEEYYVYTAEAESAITSQSTISCDAVKIVESISEFTAEFTQTATISHIEGADLFAFSEAELAAVAARIRFFNLETLAAFDIATDYGLIKQGASTEAADFALAITAELSRGFDIDMSAAFSLTADLSVIRNLNGGTQPRRTAKTVTVVGNTFLDTAQSRFGGRSARFDGINDKLSVASNIDFAFGLGAWTIELWARLNNTNINQTLVDLRNSTSSQQAVFLRVNSENDVELTVNGTERIISNNPSALTKDVWYHIAVTKAANGVHRMFINGVQQTQTWNNTTAYTQGPLNIGERVDGGNDFNGWIDDLRIVKGSALYTANFTAPTQQLDDISGTVLLLNMNLVTTNINFVDSATAEIIIPLPINCITAVETAAIKLVPLSASVTDQFTQTADAAKIVDILSSLEEEFQAETTAERIRGLDSAVSAATEFSAVISHIHGADLIVNGFATLTADVNVIRDVSLTLSSQSTVAASLTGTQLFNAAMSVTSSVFSSKWLGTYRPRTVVSTNTVFDNSIFKYGTHSVRSGQWNTRVPATGTIRRDSDLIIRDNDEFVIEWWAYRTHGLINAFDERAMIAFGGIPLSGGGSNNFGNLGRGAAHWAFGTGYTFPAGFRWTFRYNPANGDPIYINSSYLGTLDQAGWPVNTWTHFAIRRGSDGVIRVLVGGSQYITANYSDGFFGLNPNYLSMVSMDGNTPSTDYTAYDELSFRIGNSTVSGLTQPIKGDYPSQRLLLHFDGNFNDDLSVSHTANAALSSSSNLTVKLSGPVPAAAALSSQFTFVAAAGKNQEIILLAFAESQVTVFVDIVKDAAANLAVTAEVVADVTRIQEAASAIDSTATVSSDLSVITDTAAEFNNTFALSTVVEVIRDNSADLSTVSNITAAADRIRDVDTALQSISQVVAEAVKITTTDSALVSTAELLAVADRSRDHLAALTTDFVQTAQAEAILSAISEQSAEFTVTAQGFRTAEIVLSGFSAALVLIDVERIRDTAAELQDQFTVFVQTSNVIDFDIDPIDAAASLDGSLDRIRFADCSLSSESLLDCSVLITRDFSSDLTTDSSVAIEVSRILTTDSNIYAASDLNGSLSVIRDAAINTSSTASMTVAGAIVVFGEGHLFADTTVTAQGFKITEIVLTAFGNSTVTTEIEKIAGFESTVLANFIQDAAAVKIAVNDVAASAEFNVTALVERSRGFISNIDAAASVEVTATKAIEINASIVAETTLVAQGFKTTEIVLTGFSAALVLTAAERIRDTAADVASAATTTANISIVQQLSSDMSAVTEVTVTAGVQANASAALQSIGFVLTTAREIRLDSIVYKIGSETRVYKIPSESRIYKIRSK
jgi:hypothetical protein